MGPQKKRETRMRSQEIDEGHPKKRVNKVAQSKSLNIEEFDHGSD